jgi:hypothetical protein
MAEENHEKPVSIDDLQDEILNNRSRSANLSSGKNL